MANRRETEHDAAAIIRSVLALIASGELTANTAQAVAMVRRLEALAGGLGLWRWPRSSQPIR